MTLNDAAIKFREVIGKEGPRTLDTAIYAWVIQHFHYINRAGLDPKKFKLVVKTTGNTKEISLERIKDEEHV